MTIHFQDPEMLYNRDYSFIIARSPRTWAYDHPFFLAWEQVETSIIKVAKQCQEYDPDPICVYSASVPFEKYDKTPIVKLVEILHRDKPPESIDVIAPLEDTLNNYFLRRKKYIHRNGEFIIVFLDTKPVNYQRLFQVIIEATKKINPSKQKGKIYELVISFVQVGDEPRTAKFLSFVDSDLEKIGAKYHIVDSKNWLVMTQMSIQKFLKEALLHHKSFSTENYADRFV